MYYHLPRPGPIRCSKCNSLRAVNPLNEDDVDVRCLDCGHEKRAKPPQDYVTGTSVYTMPDIEKNPTF